MAIKHLGSEPTYRERFALHVGYPVLERLHEQASLPSSPVSGTLSTALQHHRLLLAVPMVLLAIASAVTLGVATVTGFVLSACLFLVYSASISLTRQRNSQAGAPFVLSPERHLLRLFVDTVFCATFAATCPAPWTSAMVQLFLYPLISVNLLFSQPIVSIPITGLVLVAPLGILLGRSPTTTSSLLTTPMLSLLSLLTVPIALEGVRSILNIWTESAERTHEALFDSVRLQASAGTTQEVLLQKVADALPLMMGGFGCSIWLHVRGTQEFHLVAARPREMIAKYGPTSPTPVTYAASLDTVTGTAIQRGTQVYLPNLHSQLAIQEEGIERKPGLGRSCECDEGDFQHTTVVPIVVTPVRSPVTRQVVAAIRVLGGPNKRVFTMKERRLAEQFAEKVADALEYISTRDRVLDFVSSLAGLTAERSPVVLCGAVAKAVPELLRANHCSVFLRDPVTNTLRLVATTSDTLRLVAEQVVYAIDNSTFTGHVASTGAPMRVPDINSDEDIAQRGIRRTGGVGKWSEFPSTEYVEGKSRYSRAFLAAPIRCREEILGVIRVPGALIRGRFSQFDQEILSGLGTLLGQILFSISQESETVASHKREMEYIWGRARELSHTMKSALGAILEERKRLEKLVQDSHSEDVTQALDRLDTHLYHALDQAFHFLASDSTVERYEKVFDFRVFMDDFVEAWRPRFSELGVECNYYWEPTREVFARLSYPLITNVLIELFENARKWAPHGTNKRIRVGISVNEATGFLHIVVANSGPPMTRDHREYLLGLKPKDTGASARWLGLWTIRTAVERMGGSLAVQSTDEESAIELRFNAIVREG